MSTLEEIFMENWFPENSTISKEEKERIFTKFKKIIRIWLEPKKYQENLNYGYPNLYEIQEFINMELMEEL